MSDLIDYVSIVTSIIAIFISVLTVKSQMRHNVLSLMPVCELYTANFDDYLSVELHNKGLGLMRINNVVFTNTKKLNYSNLIDVLSDKTGLSYNVIGNGKTIMSGEKIELIKLKEFTSEQRKKILTELSNIHLHIEYVDVYLNEYVFDYPIIFC